MAGMTELPPSLRHGVRPVRAHPSSTHPYSFSRGHTCCVLETHLKWMKSRNTSHNVIPFPRLPCAAVLRHDTCALWWHAVARCDLLWRHAVAAGTQQHVLQGRNSLGASASVIPQVILESSLPGSSPCIYGPVPLYALIATYLSRHGHLCLRPPPL
jgi:hypothetical protein